MKLTRVPKRYYPEWGFRPNTPCHVMHMNFAVMNGGMGDYICWLPALRWLASEATWINGTVIVSDYFKELAEYFMKPYPEWRVRTHTEMKDIPGAENQPTRGPIEISHCALNATGAHLLTCGWGYFANKDKAPEGIDRWTSEHMRREVGWDSYPQFAQADLDRVELPPGMIGLAHGRYAVVTTGTTTESRRVPRGSWNHVIRHIRERGLTPVFLGKEVVETGNAQNVKTTYEGIDFSLGVDLRNQTSLMQSAAILSRAAFVVGHDNGLLHLAGCTRVPIIFGYNLASPEHRRPRRPVGPIYDVTLTNEELACNHCQSRINFVIGYNFRSCLYGDNLCLRMLFENGAQRWKKKIDQALAEGT